MKKVNSVASFFISRIDTSADKVIDKIMTRLSEKIKSDFGAVIRDK